MKSETMTLGLVDILRLAGFDPSLPTGFVRHQDSRYPVEELRHRDLLELYQCYQSKPKFHNFKQIVSFYGLTGTRAGFYGVYKVHGYSSTAARHALASCRCTEEKEWRSYCKFFYQLERDKKFDYLRDRLIINWGPGTLAWVQKLANKPVLEILEPGRKLPPFVDYLEFSLTHTELKYLFENAEAHRDWQIPLSTVSGVYLILAEKTGDMYVGSAYGESGIWGRWREYANNTGHGKNVKLKKLIKSDPAYTEQFRFSVLQILPKTMTSKEVIRRETLYKEKLGTRATGLNA